MNTQHTKAVFKVRGLAAVRRCYVEAVTVIPSCSGGSNIVVA
jgi:hypothetical protein